MAAVFDAPTVIQDRHGRQFREVIRRGAFAEALQSRDVVALFNHQAASQPLGRTSSGTLRLTETRAGLSFELDLPDTTLGRDVAELIRRRDIAGMSFGWSVDRDKWTAGKDMMQRELLAIGVEEVSVVTRPAYAATSVDVRSITPAFSRLALASLRLKLADKI